MRSNYQKVGNKLWQELCDIFRDYKWEKKNKVNDFLKLNEDSMETKERVVPQVVSIQCALNIPKSYRIKVPCGNCSKSYDYDFPFGETIFSKDPICIHCGVTRQQYEDKVRENSFNVPSYPPQQNFGVR